MYPGKIYTQNAHVWHRWSSSAKWSYYKDTRPNEWDYTALHKNPMTSEKIVSWYKYHAGDGHQIWGDPN